MTETRFVVTKQVKCDACQENIFKHGRCGCRKGWIESEVDLREALNEIAFGDDEVIDEGNDQ